MNLTNKYKLNNVDMYTAYGFFGKDGASNPLLTPRKRKPVYSNNWAERNGAEWDLDAPVKYEDRQLTLSGYVIGISESDFHTKFNALKAVFANTGYQVLSCVDLGSGYDAKVFCTDWREVRKLWDIKNGGSVVVEIEIQLQEIQDA